MRARTSLRALRRFAASRSVDTVGVDARTLAQTMVDWYGTERASNVDLDDDGDMLLFQWGTHEWTKDRARFEFDLTRQLIVIRREEPRIFQLSWTALYAPTPEALAVGSGDRWCARPDEIPEFMSFIDDSDAEAVARSSRQVRATVGFERV